MSMSPLAAMMEIDSNYEFQHAPVAWQTLKTFVLAQQQPTTQGTKPCATCEYGPDVQCEQLCCHGVELVDKYVSRTASPVA